MNGDTMMETWNKQGVIVSINLFIFYLGLGK